MKNKIRIVWWIDHLGHGGSQKVLSSIVTGLAGEYPIQQAIVCLNNHFDPDLVRKIRALDIDVRILKKWKLITGIDLIQTWWWLRRNDFDVSVTFLFFADVIGLLLSRLSGITWRLSSQESSNQHYKGWHCVVLRYCLRLADVVVLNSDSYKEELRRYIPSRSKIQVIPNGVIVSKHQRAQSEFDIKRELKLAEDVYLIGSIGRLSSEKGLDVLIDALQRMDCARVHLAVIGDGEGISDLQVDVEKRGLRDQVHFLGYRTDIKKLLTNLNVLVQPSRFEGMPMTVLEAMAVGCPIIATRVGAIPQMIRDGVDGWLVRSEDPKQLAVIIKGVLEDPIEAGKRAASAQIRLKERFAFDSSLRAWERLLSEGK